MEADKESKFMQNNAPMERIHDLEAIAALYHGILPAIITEDYASFQKSLEHISLFGWNMIEMKLQSEPTLNAIKEFWQSGIAATLSSFGPTIAVIHTTDMIHDVKDIALRNQLA